MGIDLPPPATPHNSRLKSVPPSTPSNSSRSRAPSMPAYGWATLETLLPAPAPTPMPATPTNNTRRQTQLNKRLLNMGEAEESAAKRVASSATNQRQFMSLKSLRLIDADGKSSPAK